MSRQQAKESTEPLAGRLGIRSRVHSEGIAYKPFDDPRTDGGAGLSWQEIKERMLRSLAKHNLKSVLFVAGKRVDSDVGRQLVAAWEQSGHAIGNHSYSPLFFNHPEVTLAQ